MNYENFKKIVAEELPAFLEEKGCDFYTEIGVKQKANENCEALYLRPNNGNLKVMPIIPLDMLYEICSKHNMENIPETILNFLNEQLENVPEIPDFSTFFKNPEVLEKIRIKVINTKMNEEYLTKVIHRDFLDLSAIVYVDIDNGMAITLTNELFEKISKNFGISEEELFAKYIDEMEPACITSLFGVIEEMGFELGDDCSSDELSVPMPLIITNKEKLNGAAYILRKDVLRMAAEKTKADKIFIIPSSIHELLVMPFDEEKIQDTITMVQEVNDTTVEAKDLLSYNVYCYDKTDNSLSIVKTA